MTFFEVKEGFEKFSNQTSFLKAFYAGKALASKTILCKVNPSAAEALGVAKRLPSMVQFGALEWLSEAGVAAAGSLEDFVKGRKTITLKWCSGSLCCYKPLFIHFDAFTDKNFRNVTQSVRQPRTLVSNHSIVAIDFD